jgi:tetratricopeptide (TPR) repeat protein
MAEVHLGNAPVAERCLRHALELNPQSVNTLYNLGVLLLDQKKPRQAIPYLEKASQAGPSSPELSVNLIGAYLDSGNKDRALEVARSAARKFEGQPAFDLALGKCFLAHNLPAEARASLEEANRLAPLQPGVVMPLADACLRQKDAAAARKALEGIRTRARDLAEYHYLLGQSYFLSREAQGALGEIKLAAKLDPQNPVYGLTLGRYEQKYGDQQSAISALEKAARLAPDIAEIPYSMAVSYFIADDFAQASKFVERALQLDPNFDRALFLLGIVRFAQGRSSEAEELLGRTRKLRPGNPFYQCFYGMALLSENRMAEALAPLEKAVALDPSYALAHYQLGRLWTRSGRYSEASAELEKAVALQPDLSEAYYQIGQAYRRLGEKEKADRALDLFRKHHAAEYSERQEALKEMQEVVRGQP